MSNLPKIDFSNFIYNCNMIEMSNAKVYMSENKQLLLNLLHQLCKNVDYTPFGYSVGRQIGTWKVQRRLSSIQ